MEGLLLNVIAKETLSFFPAAVTIRTPNEEAPATPLVQPDTRRTNNNNNNASKTDSISSNGSSRSRRDSLWLYDQLDKSGDIVAPGKSAPSLPQDVNVLVECHRVIITWKPPKDLGGHEQSDISYIVQHKAMTTDNWEIIYEGPSAEFHLIEPPRNFFFRVAAKNGTGVSEYCMPIYGTTENSRTIFEVTDSEVEMTTSRTDLTMSFFDQEDEDESTESIFERDDSDLCDD